MQKAGESQLRFNTRRLLNFFRLMFHNKMAALGLILLIVSVAIALAAPTIYPFDPQQHSVGGQYAQPEWVTYFPEGYHLSKNLVVVNDPAFHSPSSLQEWTYTIDPAQRSSLSVDYSSSGPGQGSGSLGVSSTASTPSSVSVAKTFNYPYHGPPQAFTAFVPPSGGFQVRADGASTSQPIFVRFFLNRGTEATYTLWSSNITSSGVWTGPKTSLDSTSQDFLQGIGLLDQNKKQLTSLSAAQVVFSSTGNYSYGFKATFYGPSKLSVSSLGLDLYGTAYGLLGTDNIGNDLFAQNFWGARISLFVGLLAAFIGVFLGLIVGLVAGYKIGLVDELLMRFTDMMLVIPGLPLLIVLVGVLGANIWNIIIVLGFLGWMGFARVIRSQVLSLKERPFIEAAKAAGAGTRHILTKHIFPNIVSLTYVNLAISVPSAILSEAALAFLGLFDPSVTSWGRIINNAEGQGALNVWWWVLPPGIDIAVVSLSFVLIGYALDEIFNPKLRVRR